MNKIDVLELIEPLLAYLEAANILEPRPIAMGEAEGFTDLDAPALEIVEAYRSGAIDIAGVLLRLKANISTLEKMAEAYSTLRRDLNALENHGQRMWPYVLDAELGEHGRMSVKASEAVIEMQKYHALLTDAERSAYHRAQTPNRGKDTP